MTIEQIKENLKGLLTNESWRLLYLMSETSNFDINPENQGCYNLITNTVKSNLKIDCFLHEFGHHIDNILKNKNKQFSHNLNLYLMDDKKIIEDFIGEELIYNIIINKQMNYSTKAMFSNIFNSLRGKGIEGHSLGYLNRKPYQREEECFAHLFVLWSYDLKSYDLIKFYFRNTTTKFENILKQL